MVAMNVKFTIECEMDERWQDYFLSFLKHMEYNGLQGHSEIVGFYSDGDGDFRPRFTFTTPVEKAYKTVSPDIKKFLQLGLGDALLYGTKMIPIYDVR